MLINVFKEQVIWHRYLCWCYERCWCCSFFCCCFNFSALVSVAVIVTAPGPLFLPRIFKLSRSQTQSCRYPTFKRKASVSLSAVKYPKEHLLFSNVNPVSQAEIWLWQVDKCQCGVGWSAVALYSWSERAYSDWLSYRSVFSRSLFRAAVFSSHVRITLLRRMRKCE